jgi:hypothetical protein
VPYERILQSLDTMEDLHHIEGMQRILNEPFPRTPRYWEPTDELDPPGPLSDDAIEHLRRGSVRTSIRGDSNSLTT